MGIIVKDKSNKIFKLSLSSEDYNEKLKIVNNNQFVYTDNDLKYLLINPEHVNRPDKNGKLNLFFNTYYETTTDFTLPMEFESESICFTLNNSIKQQLSVLDGLEIKGSNYVTKFSIKDLQLEATLKASMTVIEKMKFSLVLFMYLFCISGEFVFQKGVSTYKIKSNSSEFMTYYYFPSNNRYTCGSYTKFTVPITVELVRNTFPNFAQIHNNAFYPIRVFMQSQSTIEYDIQQRVSLILNALEGFLRNTINKKNFRITISPTKKSAILASVVEAVNEHLESPEFLALLENSSGEGNIENQEIVQRVRSTLGYFTQFSFDEILEYSKGINKAGHSFVKAIHMPVKFWKRCKDHRNFHAHLTGDIHKGFNGIQSAYALYTLSSYFRFLILEVSGFDIVDTTIKKEADGINEWLTSKRILSEISEI